MEVIARRKAPDGPMAKWVVGGFIVFFFAWFIVFLVCSVISASRGNDPTAVAIMCGFFGLLFVGFFCSYIFEHIKFKRIPEEILVLDGNMFIFTGKVSCMVEEIERLRYKCAKGGRYGATTLSWGKLFVTIRSEEYKFDYVENVKKVCRVMKDIISEAEEQENG